VPEIDRELPGGFTPGDATEYRIVFSIERRRPEDDDFTEVGFGSSGARDTVNDALYDLQSIIQTRLWETRPGQPESFDLERNES
jgi:hypothetical protein